MPLPFSSRRAIRRADGSATDRGRGGNASRTWPSHQGNNLSLSRTRRDHVNYTLDIPCTRTQHKPAPSPVSHTCASLQERSSAGSVSTTPNIWPPEPGEHQSRQIRPSHNRFPHFQPPVQNAHARTSASRIYPPPVRYQRGEIQKQGAVPLTFFIAVLYTCSGYLEYMFYTALPGKEWFREITSLQCRSVPIVQDYRFSLPYLCFFAYSISICMIASCTVSIPFTFPLVPHESFQ